MIKRNIYRWHRTLSLVIAVPVLLWALSGFMHPIMTNIRPKVATQFLPLRVIDTAMIRVPLQQALEMNHIDSFRAFRIVHIGNNWFYQVQMVTGQEPLYLATLTGKILNSGNWLYAQWLARCFLEGPGTKDSSIPTHNMTMPAVAVMHDCCDAATDQVVRVKGAKVTDVSKIISYNSEYKSINRLLPVYRVAFDRADGIRIYVEPLTDRFAFAMDNRRYVFDRIFTLVHTWEWLGFLGKGKLAVELTLASLAFFTTIMGVYIFFTTRSKKAAGNKLVRARRNHRYSAIVIALFTLMFTFSGAYHAFSKFSDDDRATFFVSPVFRTADIRFNTVLLQARVKAPLTQVGIISMNGRAYWRVQAASTIRGNMPKDMMKTGMVPMPETRYIPVDKDTLLPNGEKEYARYLATVFSNRNTSDITSTEAITSFGAEYNFTDKRLPVWKISYAGSGHPRYFIETATGSLAKYVTNTTMAQDYSFSLLHKHEFLGWAGKGWKDASTMFWAMAQVVMVVVGLVLYVRWRKKR